MVKLILLIIAGQGYHPAEYGITRQILENAGMRVEVASDIEGIADATPSIGHSQICNEPQCKKVVEDYPQYATVKIDVKIDNIIPEKYDGIFIIGGPGAMEFLDNAVVYKIINDTAQTGKPYGAICISPRILAHAKVITGKQSTGWNGDHKLEDIFKEHGVIYIKKAVVRDNNLITADGPSSSINFAEAIVDFILTK